MNKTNEAVDSQLERLGEKIIRQMESDAPKHSLTEFCGKYGEMYKDYLEMYKHGQFEDMVLDDTLWDACIAKNEEIHQFIDDTVKSMLVNDPAPDNQHYPLEWTQHINALTRQAEELAEPMIFGGKHLAELGEPTSIPMNTYGRRKNMFFDGTQEEWERADMPF